MKWAETIIVETERPKLSPDLIRSVLNLTPEMASAYRHPGTTEPPIIDYVINNFTNRGDVVFDPMCGTGTIIRRALQLGRDAYGMEVVEQYALLANAAIMADTGFENRVQIKSALQIQGDELLCKLSPVKLFFFSPPLLDVNRGPYPPSNDQIGNYQLGQEGLWLHSIRNIMQQIKGLLGGAGFMAIVGRNQSAGDYILPLTQFGVMAALEVGYKLVDEKVILFQPNPNRSPELLHVFKP